MSLTLKSPEKRGFSDYFFAFRENKLSVIKPVLISLFFAILVFGIYSNTFKSPFVLDDVIRIEKNPHIRLTQFSLEEIGKAGIRSSKTRPIAFISFALNYYFHQYNLLGYHIVNIIIHIFTGFFIYLFLKTTLKISAIGSQNEHLDLIAFSAVLIWLVNPVQTQSVTYIVQRMNSMASMFFILSFLFYAYGRLTDENKKKWLWFIASAFAWLLSLGCKQICAVLPFMIILYEWYFFQNLSKDWIKKYLKYFLGIVIIFILLVLIYTDFNPIEKFKNFHDYANNEFTIAERMLTQFRVVIHYISLIFFPHPSRLNLDYDFPLSYSLINPVTTIFSLGAIIGLVTLAVYLAKKERLISFCILWFLGNQVIESSFIPLALIFEHRNYLPSMLVFLIPVALGYRYIKLDWLRFAVLCVVVVLFSIWTYQRNRVWANEVTLWQDCVKKSPNKARPHNNLGEALANKGIMDKAIEHYYKALQANPNYYQAHVNWGKALEMQDKADAAIEHYLAALRIKPNIPEGHNNLGVVLAKKGKNKEAIEYYLKALKIRPDYAQAQFNLGVALAEQGKTEQAINRFYQALKINPGYAEVHNNLGGILAGQGKTDQAIHHYTEALRLNPHMVEAHNNLGISSMQGGKIEAAIFHFKEALRLNPDFVLAENNLKKVLSIQRRIEGEIARIQEELKNRPDDPVLHYQMGNLFLSKGELSKAISQYEKALSFQPKFVQALNNLALVYTKKKVYAKALAAFQKMAELQPENTTTYYNIAVVHALQNNIEESIEWLKRAVNKGYQNWELIQTDKDLENIRNSEQYKEIIKGH